MEHQGAGRSSGARATLTDDFVDAEWTWLVGHWDEEATEADRPARKTTVRSQLRRALVGLPRVASHASACGWVLTVPPGIAEPGARA